LNTIQALLTHCHPLDSPLIPTRLAKAVLPSLSVVLATPTESEDTENTAAASTRSKKGKKRARGYEGDEIFKLSRGVVCPSLDDGNVLIAAFEGALSHQSLYKSQFSLFHSDAAFDAKS
jgi:hypothetical protein